MTKRLSSFAFALPLAAGIAFAQQPPQPPPQDPSRPPAEVPQAPAKPVAGNMEVPADVIAADAEAKTIKVTVLIRNESGGQASPKDVTIPVDEEAVPALKTVNPGDRVKLLCRMNETGKVAAVKSITRNESKTDPSKQ